VKGLCFALGLALLIVFAGGCARRGPLRAPEEVRPAPVQDLRARTLDGQVELVWSRPQRSETGRKVEEIETFVIERQCPGAGQSDFSLLTTIGTGERRRIRKVTSYRYRHDLARELLPCRYRVVSKTYDGYVSQPSNVVEIGP
jgi:predicted small lipoprotein YifL